MARGLPVFCVSSRGYQKLQGRLRKDPVRITRADALDISIGLRRGCTKAVIEVALILRSPQNIAGFKAIEETEIPQLQAHCEKLTETGRSANCKTFINKLSQLLNSLTLWASSDGTSSNMTAEQRAREARYLQKGLQALENVSSRSPDPMYK